MRPTVLQVACGLCNNGCLVGPGGIVLDPLQRVSVDWKILKHGSQHISRRWYKAVFDTDCDTGQSKSIFGGDFRELRVTFRMGEEVCQVFCLLNNVCEHLITRRGEQEFELQS